MLVLRRGRRSSSGYPALPCQQQQNIESEYLPSSKIPTHKEREVGGNPDGRRIALRRAPAQALARWPPLPVDPREALARAQA